jgi:hypothetical protein
VVSTKDANTAGCQVGDPNAPLRLMGLKQFRVEAVIVEMGEKSQEVSMRAIRVHLTEEINKHVNHKSVAKSEGYLVKDFMELTHQISHLSYLNKDFLLFFRGQTNDFRNKARASTLFPSIYRKGQKKNDQEVPKFTILDSASILLCDALKKAKLQGWQDVKRRKYIQWSILQHYGVCETPLLDFTHSLLVACSFAFFEEGLDDPYVFVVGLPYITNRITINSEHNIVNVRLLSICPPEAKRPFFQEGYLAGTEDITTNYDTKKELDFNQRLVAKFVLQRKTFLGDINLVSKDMLFPPKDDRVYDICVPLKKAVEHEFGKYFVELHDLESKMVNKARKSNDYITASSDAAKLLRKQGLVNDGFMDRFKSLRTLRNRLVSDPRMVESAEISRGLEDIHLASI